ncbi:hypothetical protein EDC26_103124 [Paralcaligenes ureilyticus]|uniref:Uncharacterized protein n=1 Tax=Paralcaligenes ureilyticus TaxID=627131 RepID=A0A4R3M8P5_9BURK|nr:hypothetical protein EDC26_103124 [Paralcaligenes ureilyticus]
MQHRRFGSSRSNNIHRDASMRELQGTRSGKPEQGGFSGGILAAPRCAHCSPASYQDNSSPIGHDGDRCIDHGLGSQNMNAPHGYTVLHIERTDRIDTHEAGRVDQRINIPVTRKQHRDSVSISKINAPKFVAFNLPVVSGRQAIKPRNSPAMRKEALSYRGAYSRTGPGDDRAPSYGPPTLFEAPCTH